MPVIQYEGARLELDIREHRDRALIKRAAGQFARRILRRPLRNDGYLRLARTLLSQRPDAVIIDVGANIGATVFPLSNQFPEAHFLAIEPHPLPAAILLRNRRRNPSGNVRLLSIAIGERGLVDIHTCRTSNGGHRLSGFAGRAGDDEVVGVSVLPLSELLTSPTDLLKIDTEGHETAVLRSLGDRLTPSMVHTVVCEYGPEGLRSAGSSGEELLALMTAAGYTGRDLQTGRPLVEVPALPDYHVVDWVFEASA